MKRTDIYLTEKQHKVIKDLSCEKGITFSEMFRRIVDQYLEENSCLPVDTAQKSAKTSSVQNRAE